MKRTPISELLNVEPLILTIIPTHKCTALCDDCCFGCTPQITHFLDVDTIKKYIYEAMNNFPSIRLIVISGGECFLLGKNLNEIIRYSKSFNLITRVVTNAYWATTYDKAVERLSQLVEAGLTEINFSTGDSHQKFVPFENIVNATKAAYDLGIRAICISVETPPNAIFKSNEIKNNAIIAPMIEEGIVTYIDASWMRFKRNDSLQTPPLSFRQKKPCRHIFNELVINPYSQMLACCGLTVEYNPYLKLGCLDTMSIKDLYDSQYNDFFKFWLFVDGPEYIYEMVMKWRGIEKKWFPHDCAYCIELVKDKENIATIKEHIDDELSGIIYRYKINNTRLTSNL